MAKEPRMLYGKVAAVTGGARGIGLATAKAFAREGMKVAIGDLDPEQTAKVAEEIGGGARGYGLDVTSRESFQTFVDAVERDLGPLDVIVNNAGIMHLGNFHEEDDLHAIRQVDINIHGVILGTKIALASMRPRRTGHIVNVASSAGKGGYPGGATYCATKHAVVGLTEAVRAENADLGIEFSIVMPGVVNTELADGLVPARGVKNSEPHEVADAIVAALQFPKVDVFVPAVIGPINRVMGVAPRVAREGVARALRADKVLWAADAQKRARYEDRAAHSEPKLDEPAALPAAAPAPLETAAAAEHVAAAAEGEQG